MSTYTFQAEIKQLLDILVHSLYSERDIFLRELISNASDALHRVQFELLTNRDVVDPEAELYIEVKFDEEARTITVSDTGIGMTEEDMVNNLGVIAKSGAKAFVEAMKGSNNGSSATDVIGQFGVGFYSSFMVAEKVRVISRSYLLDAQAVAWESAGDDQFVIEPAERDNRGTDIILYLREEDKEFLSSWKLKEIVRTHSNYIPFPIYVNEEEEPTNKQKAIWRRSTSDVSDDEYNDFYKMMTMDFGGALHRIHMHADVPLQFYALMFVPSTSEPNMFSPRKEAGLQLYARKVLIQDYAKDLLPEYLSFIQGVVDSEDIPLNVNRESVQANRVMATLRKTLTSKVINELKRMAKKNTEEYLHIYEQFSRYLKSGVVNDPGAKEDLLPLLYFASTHDDDPDDFHSLDDYIERMAENQDDIYYIIGDDWHSARRSPHLDSFRQREIEVLYFTDPVDAALIMGLTEYKGHKLRNVDEADIDLNNMGELKEDDAKDTKEALPEATFETLRERFKSVLGKRVRDVRASKSLTGNPARLVSDEGNTSRQMFRINRLLDKEFELPVKILELNPRHILMHNLTAAVDSGDSKLVNAVIEQIFENALLQDGIHPDPASMTERINLLMQAATGTATSELDFESAPGTQEPEDKPFDMPAGMPDIEAMIREAQAAAEAAGDADDADVEDAEFTDVE